MRAASADQWQGRVLFRSFYFLRRIYPRERPQNRKGGALEPFSSAMDRRICGQRPTDDSISRAFQCQSLYRLPSQPACRAVPGQRRGFNRRRRGTLREHHGRLSRMAPWNHSPSERRGVASNAYNGRARHFSKHLDQSCFRLESKVLGRHYHSSGDIVHRLSAHALESNDRVHDKRPAFWRESNVAQT